MLANKARLCRISASSFQERSLESRTWAIQRPRNGLSKIRNRSLPVFWNQCRTTGRRFRWLWVLFQIWIICTIKELFMADFGHQTWLFNQTVHFVSAMISRVFLRNTSSLARHRPSCHRTSRYIFTTTGKRVND
jgi:hypothetical protein